MEYFYIPNYFPLYVLCIIKVSYGLLVHPSGFLTDDCLEASQQMIEHAEVTDLSFHYVLTMSSILKVSSFATKEHLV
jgi:hypothetical protein